MKKPTGQQTWIGVVMFAMTILSGYLGVEKYQQSEGDVDIIINSHAHGEVISRDAIAAMIKAATDAHHKEDAVLFKQKESWEKGG